MTRLYHEFLVYCKNNRRKTVRGTVMFTIMHDYPPSAQYVPSCFSTFCVLDSDCTAFIVCPPDQNPTS